ncbi:MAG: CBS domain-containing protein [Anaerolineales bacterium]
MISWNASVIEAHQLMLKNEIRRLPVMDEEMMVGIVTLGDVRIADPSVFGGPDMAVISSVYSKLAVDRVMSRPVITVEPDTSVREAARVMLENKIAGLPVLEEDRLVGIFSESDIFRMIVETAADPISEIIASR